MGRKEGGKESTRCNEITNTNNKDINITAEKSIRDVWPAIQGVIVLSNGTSRLGPFALEIGKLN